MSGHSKWHNIQKTKGAADAKRAQAFTKIAREMIVAVKEGGSGDPRSNSKLASVIAKAKAANMPNDNIKRTIDKALGSGNTDNYEKITYEGYGPSGVAIIVETMTDNRNRTAGEVRHLFDKYGGSMGVTGCVSWSFDRKGVIVIDDEDEELDEDTMLLQFPMLSPQRATRSFLLRWKCSRRTAISSFPMRTKPKACRRCSTCWTTMTTSRTSGTTGKTLNNALMCAEFCEMY